jgi:mitogen-activated protein kinase kinase kinase 3
MSLRSSSRRGSAFARKQSKYKIESESEEEEDSFDNDDDDDDETKDESSKFQFGGVLATLKNDTNSRNQRKTTSSSNAGKSGGYLTSSRNKKIVMTSPPLKKITKEQGKAARIPDETNGRTPPPRSIRMTTRSAMKAISPLTTQKLTKQQRRQNSKIISSEEKTRTDDSFASDDDDDDDDDETRHQTLSSVEETSKSRSSVVSDSENSESEDEDEEEEEEEYEDSYEESESASEPSSEEFEFGVDDEEFIPDEEDEESAAMSEFIVDDVSEEISHGIVPNNNSPASNSDNIDNDADTDDDVHVLQNSDTPKSGCSNNDTSNDEDIDPDIEEDTYAGTESATGDDDDDGDEYNTDNDDDKEQVEETPAKAGLSRRTLDFDSPEPQMAMIVDDDEVDDGDILLATIIDSDTVGGDTIVLTFDEDEEIDAENNEAISDQETMQRTPQSKSKENPCRDEMMKKTLAINDDDKKNPQKYGARSLSSQSDERHVSHEKSISNTEENDKETDSSGNVNLVPPVSSKNNAKTQVRNHYRQEGEVKRGKWSLGARIGVGSFGQVYVGMNTQTGVLMAVKKFKMEGAIMQDIRTEVELMRSLKHTNIVRYLGAQMDKEHLHIFQEWVPGGSVSCLLSKFGSFSIEVIQSYISQTLIGLSYLHDNDIMHRDIKGSNILVNDEGIVKLADFGASKKLKNLASNMMMSLTVRGTPYFMAPEVFEEKYSAKADIWGIGCVAIQMVTSTPPWKESGFTNPISLFNHIKKNKGSPPMEHPQKESFSKRQKMLWTMLEAFVSRCFEQDPSERPSARELLDDPFVSIISEVHPDDDESTHYRGLFSPGNESKNYRSPNQPSLPAKHKSPGHHLIQTKEHEMPWKSPSCPKKSLVRENSSVAKNRTPPKQQKTRNSPSPDAREWPVWAKNQLQKEHNCKPDHPCKNKQTSKGNICELMDSLAFSEDSSHIGQKLLTERRSSTIGGSTASSNLIGLKFLETTKSNPTK